MKGHRYRVTVEHLAAAREGQPVQAQPLTFETVNHDELFAIVEKVQGKNLLPADEAASLAIGLKLLSEVAIHHRNEPLYAELYEAMGAFIKKLKSAEPYV